MSNPLTDAVVASVASGFDVNAVATRDLIRAEADKRKQDVIDRKGETIENLERKLQAAVDRKAQPSVIAAYEKLLTQAIGN